MRDAPSGVYPVRLQLVDTGNGQSVGAFTTHLIFTETPASTQRLRVAVILPIAATLTPATGPDRAQLTARPGAALDQPSAEAVSDITATVATIAEAHPTVPVTLETSPQTVAELAATGHQSTVAELASLADTPQVHEFTSAPYVPVDASDLVGAGLGSELALQVSRGSQVLATYLPRSATPAVSAWISNDGVDAATLSQLETEGYRQLVVPSTSVPEAPTNGSAAEPFPLSPTTGTPVVAVTADADLASRFTGAPGNPVLAASQLVAELAQIYFEKPNDSTPRIVAVVAPTGWSDDPAFVGTLLSALDDNPLVEPVITSDLFGILPTTACRTACHSVPGPVGNGLPVADIRTQRQRIGGLVAATSTPAARAVTTQLGDLVLAGESEQLRPAQQAGVLHNTDLAVSAQLGQLQVAGGQSITLTSQRGRVPVTIISERAVPGDRGPHPHERQAPLPRRRDAERRPRPVPHEQLLRERGDPGLGPVQGGRDPVLPRRRRDPVERSGQRTVHRHLGGGRGALPRGSGGAAGLVVAHLEEAALGPSAPGRRRRGRRRRRRAAGSR